MTPKELAAIQKLDKELSTLILMFSKVKLKGDFKEIITETIQALLDLVCEYVALGVNPPK